MLLVFFGFCGLQEKQQEQQEEQEQEQEQEHEEKKGNKARGHWYIFNC